MEIANLMQILGLSGLDLLALVWFVACWLGYLLFSDWWGMKRPSLIARMDHYRREWMRQVIGRDNRIVDAAILQNLFQGNNFLASTAMLVLGGLAAVMGTASDALSIVSTLPLAKASTVRAFEVKVLLLAIIFVYAFFKFTWAMRQFNFASIMLGAAPDKNATQEHIDAFIQRAATLASLAGENSNRGLRAFYFAMAAMTWFLDPVIFMATSTLVVGILYQREFRSRTLLALMD
jgi:uncharacterized membrane protein